MRLLGKYVLSAKHDKNKASLVTFCKIHGDKSSAMQWIRIAILNIKKFFVPRRCRRIEYCCCSPVRKIERRVSFPKDLRRCTQHVS